MNSKPKNSLDYSEAQLFQYSDNTVIDVETEKEEDNSSSKYVLIKHDYYSSDSDHGREMMNVFISGLCDSQFDRIVIYLVDRGTALLNKDNPLFTDMKRLVNKAEIVIADEESASQYDINLSDNPKVITRSFRSIAEDLIYLSDLLVLE